MHEKVSQLEQTENLSLLLMQPFAWCAGSGVRRARSPQNQREKSQEKPVADVSNESCGNFSDLADSCR